jgi:hypothetical protein
MSFRETVCSCRPPHRPPQGGRLGRHAAAHNGGTVVRGAGPRRWSERAPGELVAGSARRLCREGRWATDETSLNTVDINGKAELRIARH